MQNQNLNKFKLEITQEKSKFFHVGQLTIPKEIIKIYKGKFWDLVAKNTTIPGFRANKAPIEQVKKYRGQDFFDENYNWKQLPLLSDYKSN
jgi:FKBP-type peptidyl-prolyl cis-trans isomerase (trigger factor)